MPDSERLTLSTSSACRSRRQVLVDDADAAVLGQGDGHAALGDRVHGRREQGDVQGDVLGEAGRSARTWLGWTSE